MVCPAQEEIRYCIKTQFLFGNRVTESQLFENFAMITLAIFFYSFRRAYCDHL